MSASDIDAVWATLEPHIDLPEGFVLVLIYADHPQPLDELWARARALVGGHSERLMPAGEDAPEQVDGWLRKSAPGQRRLAWIELYREDRLDDRARARILGQLNRARSFVERALACPLVLVLPPRLRGEASALAPDLWAIRSLAVTIQAEAAPVPGAPLSVEASGSIDVLIITAFKEELDALLAVEDGRVGPWVRAPGPLPIHRATFAGSGGPLEVAAARATRMGGSAPLAEQLIGALRPRSLTMCGVCAGRPGATEIGDVIIANFVQTAAFTHAMSDQWLRAAQDLAGPATRLHGYGTPDIEDAKWWLLEQLHAGRDPLASTGFERYFPGEHRQERLAHLIHGLGHVSGERGRFRLTDAGEAALLEHRALHGQPVSRLPYRIHVGPILSGDYLVEGDDPWRQLGTLEVLGLDVEAATLGRMARAHELPFAVVKGVTDHADSHEHEHAKAFAARASAEVLCALLREVGGELAAPPERTKAELRGLELDITILERALLSAEEPSQMISERLRRFRRQLHGGPALDSGDLLGGRYRLLNIAGEGGFATVWRAADRQTEDVVAVEVLHEQWSVGPPRARFEASARRMLTLTHEAIVEMRAPPQRDGPHIFFVMRWYEGGDLRRASSNGTLDRRAGLRALARALDGLAYAHTQGVVHGNVEPGNILIDGEGRGYIGDFGLALATAARATFVYTAPELVRDAGTAGIRADIYGAGMCALFVLAGQDPPALVERTEPAFIEGLSCGPRLRTDLTRAVAYSVDERMQEVGELTAALRDELARSQADEPPSE